MSKSPLLHLCPHLLCFRKSLKFFLKVRHGACTRNVQSQHFPPLPRHILAKIKQNKNILIHSPVFCSFSHFSLLTIQFKALQVIQKGFDSTVTPRHQTCSEVNLEYFIRHLRQRLADSLPIGDSITTLLQSNTVLFS